METGDHRTLLELCLQLQKTPDADKYVHLVILLLIQKNIYKTLQLIIYLIHMMVNIDIMISLESIIKPNGLFQYIAFVVISLSK